MIGLVLGLAANFMMEAPMMAGQILGVQMGYSLATLFDPQTKADTPVLAEFHRLAALLIFLQLDVHHWLLRAVVSSFAYLPGGSGPRHFRRRQRPAARRGRNFSGRGADCRARSGGHAGGGCRLWDFSGKLPRSFPCFSSGLRSRTCWAWRC